MASSYGGSSDIPRISSDYYLGVTSSGTRYKPFVTREEKFLRVQHNFAKAFKEEQGEKLPKGSKGLVVVQMGHYPMDFDIIINPEIKHYCVKQAIYDQAKLMRQPYVFASRTYWLNAGKVELLLDSESVLSLAECERAVYRIMTLKGEKFDLLYMGVQLCKNRALELPFRVWRLQRKDLSVTYLLANLLNGSMFELTAEGLPEMVESPKKFMVGVVHFAVEENGDYLRG